MLIWRLVLFGVFSLLAAPLEYHLKWWAPWSRGTAMLHDAITAPLIHGAFFIYAVILAVEAFFRLEMYPDRATRNATYMFKILCGVAPLAFVAYLVRGIDSPLSGEWITAQWYLAIFCLMLSLFVFLYLEKTDKILSDVTMRSR